MLFLALIAALAVATLGRAQLRRQAAEVMFPPQGQILKVGAQRVHAVVMGPETLHEAGPETGHETGHETGPETVSETGSGPDLVLIHGSSGNTRDFTFDLAPILARRYRVIILDRPGLGWSDPLPRKAASIFDQARVLAAAAAQLGASRPLVLGQSYGGAVALAWALDHPAAGLVTLAGPSHRWDGPLPWLYRINAHPLLRWIVPELIAAWVPAAFVRRQTAETFAPQDMPEGYDRAIAAGLTLRPFSLRANATHRATLKHEIHAMMPRYATLTLPFELVHGTADPIVGAAIHAEPMAAEVASANLTLLPGIGHMPQHVAIPEVIAAIDRAATRAGLR